MAVCVFPHAVSGQSQFEEGLFGFCVQMGKEPYVCVWDALAPDCKELARLNHAHGESVIGLAFTANGNKLLSCSVLGRFQVHVWDWRRKIRLLQSAAWNGTVPAMVFGLLPGPAPGKGGEFGD